jgi:predicted chitinase
MTIATDNLPGDYNKGSQRELRVNNFKRIIAQLEASGITNDNCQAAICGILMRECTFLATEESAYYSYAALGQFKRATEAARKEYGGSVKAGRKTKEEFFGWLYGTSYPHGSYQEGSKYFGRGFVQLTGFATYSAATKAAKGLGWDDLDFVKNPESALSSENNNDTRALICLLVCKFGSLAKLQSKQSDPNIFNIIERYFNPGEPAGQIAQKRKYYEFFLSGGKGTVPIVDSIINPKPTNKNAGGTDAQHSVEEIKTHPKYKQEALTDNRDGNLSKNGFTDPFGKYPLREYMNEADTNRLARGMIKNTCVEFKDSMRNTDIPSVHESSFSQPSAPYSTMYPFNKVMESESGHILEFDDSPNAERINLFHRAGTYTEVDENGTQVNQIIGDGYWITERNGNVYIKGACNVTIVGDMNLLCQGDSTVEVNGNTEMIYHGDATIGVANNLSINVAENFEISVGKNFNIEYGKVDENPDEKDVKKKTYGGMTFKTPYGKLGFESPSDITFKAGAAIRMESATTTTINSKGDFLLYTPANASIKASTINLTGNVPLENYVTLTATDSRGDKHTQLTGAGSGTDTAPETPESIAVSYNPQSTVVVGDEDPATNTTSESIYFKRGTLTGKYPDKRASSGVNLEPLKTGERRCDSAMKFESEEEINSSPAGKALIDKENAERSLLDGGQPDKEIDTQDELTPNAEGSDALTNSSVGGYSVKPGSKLNSSSDSNLHNTIAANKSFPLNFKISKHFCLGNFVQPGTNIADIMLPPGSIYGGGGAIRKYTVSELVDNLAYLAENIAEPIYDLLGPTSGKYAAQDPSGKWSINDGIRTEGNKSGSKTSDHFKGMAMDIRYNPARSHEDVYNLAVTLDKLLPAYSQMILEYDTHKGWNWIHIAYNKDHTNTDKKGVGKMTGVNGKYTHGTFILYK